MWLKYPATAPFLHLALPPRITPAGPAHQLPRRATTRGPGPSTTNTFHTNPWPLFLPSDVTGLFVLTHLSKLALLTSQELSFLTLLQRPRAQSFPEVWFSAILSGIGLAEMSRPPAHLGKGCPRRRGPGAPAGTSLRGGHVGQAAAHVAPVRRDRQTALARSGPVLFTQLLRCFSCKMRQDTPLPGVGITC